ncbi:hypothetical protein [uncultured Clostridium sp.]|uniref:hypothetical protein n=1 Tax=uncultured Clostridium sp. TaxID=59620 RepID=UPI003216F572
MSDLLDKELESQIEEGLEEVSDIQEMADMVGFEEEIKRIEKQDKPLEVPKEYEGTQVYKVATEEAYAIAKAFRILLDSGIDYSNAVSLANNSVVGYGNRELQKISSVQVQTQQI